MLLVRIPDNFAAERNYVLSVVLGEFMGLQWRSVPGGDSAIELTRADDQDAGKLTIADQLFDTPQAEWLNPGSLPRRPLPRWSWQHDMSELGLVEPELPVLYGKAPFFDADGGTITLGIDVLGSIFFQLTRYEEIAAPVADEHDRFPARASLAYRERFLERPLVDEYVQLLRCCIKRLWPSVHFRRAEFQQLLSHDVDWPTHPPASLPALAKSLVGDTLRRRDGGLATSRLRAARARRQRRPEDDPYWSFEQIMNLSEEHGLRSAFYFMAGRTDPRFDGVYHLEEPSVVRLLRQINERGHEIGLHPSYGTFRDPDAISTERDALVAVCERLGVRQASWGGRQHYLRWENPTTWRGWEQAGLTYDSSLGYAREPGFRCGTSHEYPVFDLLGRRPLALRERPLLFMDLAAIEASAEKEAASLQLLAMLRERCRMFGGQFTLLWHNSRLASPRERRLYRLSLQRR